MEYNEVVDFLYAQLPMYQRVGGKAIKAGLENILKFSEVMDNPHEKFKSVHIAGTNGKGSTAHFLASVLQEAGYKVGLHTSPHLKDFRERIKINGQMIPQEEVVAFVENYLDLTKVLQPSFFEWSVALTFYYFAKEKVDIAIVETGLGGRLDSTNILLPEVSVITNIGLDHCAFLGNTLSEIAGEKAGIIKKAVPVVVGARLPETQKVFEKIAEKFNAPLHFAALPLEEKGGYQSYNLETVKAALKILMDKGWIITEGNVEDGIAHMKSNTGLRGRWDVLAENPKIICDVGHNEDGIRWVSKQLKEEVYDQLHMVLGVSADKAVEPMFKTLPQDAVYYFCKADVPRAMEPDLLKKHGLATGKMGEAYKTVKDALNAAKKNANEKDLIFVGGSVFVVGEII